MKTVRPSAIRPLLWGLDAVLLAVCGLLVTRTTLAVTGALGEPPIAPPSPPAAVAPPEPEPAAPAIIVTRDLFGTTATPEPPPPRPQVEDVEATELPVGLLGTVYSADPELARAAVWNALRGEHRVVAAGDPIADGAATVLRIERERILLREDGDVREISLDDAAHRPPSRAQKRARLKAMVQAQRKRRR